MLHSIDPQQLGQYSVASLVTDYTQLSDEELMQEIERGQEPALGELHRRHVALLRAVVARVINQPHEVDDVMQEIFLQVWRQAGHYRNEKGKVLGWLITLSRRRAIDRARRLQAYHRALDRCRLEGERASKCGAAPVVQPDPSQSDTAEMLRKLMDNLPEAQRKVLDLAYYGGLSQREIAARTKTPLGTIKTRLELAVAKMRSALRALGGAREWIDGSNAPAGGGGFAAA